MQLPFEFKGSLVIAINHQYLFTDLHATLTTSYLKVETCHVDPVHDVTIIK